MQKPIQKLLELFDRNCVENLFPLTPQAQLLNTETGPESATSPAAWSLEPTEGNSGSTETLTSASFAKARFASEEKGHKRKSC